MTTVSSATSGAATTGTGSISPLSIDSTGFLKLMVQQLKQQNPLNPTDSNTFMQQMLSYANFDQVSSLNNTVGSISTSLNSFLSANAVSYIGDMVTAKGATNMLTRSGATWEYSLDSNTARTTITIKDSSGQTVYTTTGATSSGPHTFTWDGSKTGGGKASDGAYTISVTATDANGKALTGTTSITGKVTGVDTSTGTTKLEIGDVAVNLSDLQSVSTS